MKLPYAALVTNPKDKELFSVAAHAGVTQLIVSVAVPGKPHPSEQASDDVLTPDWLIAP
jgi:hypothetical protein